MSSSPIRVRCRRAVPALLLGVLACGCAAAGMRARHSGGWSAAPPLEPRGTHGAVVLRGRIHVFGGESQAHGASLAEVLRFDAGSGAWKALPPLATARTYPRAVVLGGAVYVVGGSPTPGSSHSAAGSAVVERYVER